MDTRQPADLSPVAATDHVRGAADAPVTIVEYGDYECPFCRGAARDVHTLLDRYGDAIRFVFRNFPVPQLHPHAEQAAEAAEAAGAQGKFWEMYELLLDPHAELDTDALVDYASRIGLDLDRFKRDLATNAHADRIRHDIDTGIASRVNSTPKFYVNGKRIDVRTPLEDLFESVRAAVAAANRTG